MGGDTPPGGRLRGNRGTGQAPEPPARRPDRGLPVFDSDIPAAHLSRAGAGNEHRHHELLRAFTLWPGPLQSTHVNAASDPEAIRLPG